MHKILTITAKRKCHLITQNKWKDLTCRVLDSGWSEGDDYNSSSDRSDGFWEKPQVYTNLLIVICCAFNDNHQILRLVWQTLHQIGFKKCAIANMVKFCVRWCLVNIFGRSLPCQRFVTLGGKRLPGKVLMTVGFADSPTGRAVFVLFISKVRGGKKRQAGERMIVQSCFVHYLLF